jgi:hypothetical protein
MVSEASAVGSVVKYAWSAWRCQRSPTNRVAAAMLENAVERSKSKRSA